MSLPTRRESLGYSKLPFHEVFPFFYRSALVPLTAIKHMEEQNQFYICVQLMQRGASMACRVAGQRAPGELDSLMSHHDSSSNSSIDAIFQQCPGNKALLLLPRGQGAAHPSGAQK